MEVEFQTYCLDLLSNATYLSCSSEERYGGPRSGDVNCAVLLDLYMKCHRSGIPTWSINKKKKNLIGIVIQLLSSLNDQKLK